MTRAYVRRNMGPAEYKRWWREQNRQKYLASQRKSQRKWRRKFKKWINNKLKAKRHKAIDRGRCGMCVVRYREPGFNTCRYCLDKIAVRRQIKREMAA